MSQKHKFNQNGHVAIEWALVTVVVVIALFADIPGQDQSVIGLMMSSIRDFYRHISFLISLP